MADNLERLKKLEIVSRHYPNGFEKPSIMAEWLAIVGLRNVAFCRAELSIGLPYRNGHQNLLVACIAAPYINTEGQVIDDPNTTKGLLSNQDIKQIGERYGITGISMLKKSCPEIGLTRGKITPLDIPRLSRYSLMYLFLSRQTQELAEQKVDVILPYKKSFEVLTIDIVVNYLLGLKRLGWEIRTFDSRPRI